MPTIPATSGAVIQTDPGVVVGAQNYSSASGKAGGTNGREGSDNAWTQQLKSSLQNNNSETTAQKGAQSKNVTLSNPKTASVSTTAVNAGSSQSPSLTSKNGASSQNTPFAAAGANSAQGVSLSNTSTKGQNSGRAALATMGKDKSDSSASPGSAAPGANLAGAGAVTTLAVTPTGVSFHTAAGEANQNQSLPVGSVSANGKNAGSQGAQSSSAPADSSSSAASTDTSTENGAAASATSATPQDHAALLNQLSSSPSLPKSDDDKAMATQVASITPEERSDARLSAAYLHGAPSKIAEQRGISTDATGSEGAAVSKSSVYSASAKGINANSASSPAAAGANGAVAANGWSSSDAPAVNTNLSALISQNAFAASQTGAEVNAHQLQSLGGAKTQTLPNAATGASSAASQKGAARWTGSSELVQKAPADSTASLPATPANASKQLTLLTQSQENASVSGSGHISTLAQAHLAAAPNTAFAAQPNGVVAEQKQEALTNSLLRATSSPNAVVSQAIAANSGSSAASQSATTLGGAPAASNLHAQNAAAVDAGTSSPSGLHVATAGGQQIALSGGSASLLNQQTRASVLGSTSEHAGSGALSAAGGSKSQNSLSAKSSDGNPGSLSAAGASAAAISQSGGSTGVSKSDPVQNSSMEERISVINQITQNIASMNDNSPSNVQTATFHVRPEHWGEMKITVKITDDGNTGKMRGVEAVLTTSSESARQVLLQNTSELRKSLEEHGMKLDKLDIVVSPSGATQTSSSQTVAQSAHTDQSTGQSFQSASAFTQGGGSGNHSQGSGSGQGQTNANPSHLSARTASPTQATMHVASTTAGPSKGSNRLVDYRI